MVYLQDVSTNQSSAAPLRTHSSSHDHITLVLQKLHWHPSASNTSEILLLTSTYKVLHNLAPAVVPSATSNLLILINTKPGETALLPSLSPPSGTVFPQDIRNIPTPYSFKWLSTYTFLKPNLNLVGLFFLTVILLVVILFCEASLSSLKSTT